MKKQLLLACVFFTQITNVLYADSNPTMSRIYGNQFTPEIAQTRSAAQIGILDTSFNIPNSYIIPSNGNYACAVQALYDGTFVVLNSNTTSSSWLSKYTAEGSLYTAGTFGTSGVLALSGYSTVNFMTLDAQNRILISGADDNTGSHYPWIQRITTVGAVDSAFTFADGASWTSSGQINQLAQQTTELIIAVGYNGTNAMLARYRINGSLDTSFGNSGYVILNGTNSLPTSTVSLYSVVIDSDDKIYVAYVNATPSVYVIRLTQDGVVDTGWNSGNPVNISYLNGTSMVTSQLRMIIDSVGDLVVAVPSESTTVIKAASITSATGAAGSFANVTMNSSSPFGASSAYDLRNMIASSNGSVYFVASNTTSKEMAVIRYTTAGVLDTVFNGTGVNFFNISSPSTNALLYSASISPTGDIYAAGSQLNSGTTTPYVSRLYSTQYATQTAQFPPATDQGLLDLTFGNATDETYAGVVAPFNGSYQSTLKQKAVGVIEIVNGPVRLGQILVGMNGLTDNTYRSASENSYSNMMFSWLTSSGEPSSTLTLQNLSNSNEYMTNMVEDESGNIYVSGYTSSNTAIMRMYTVTSAGNANIAVSQSGSGWQGVSVSLQEKRSLLSVAESSTVGHISGYVLGSLDNTFGVSGSGYINPTSYGLNMGPCYSIIVNDAQSIFTAYVKNGTSQVDVVKFLADGSNVDTGFNTTGIVADLFTAGSYSVTPSNVRMTFKADGNLIVTATSGTNLLVAYLDYTTGALIGSVLVVSVTNSTSLNLTRVTGVSDGTAVITFWDNSTDDTMYIARVTSARVLDTTGFNSQGSIQTNYQPGILALQIGDKVTNYNSRVVTSALVQSSAGANQGNIVTVGYESVTSSDSTPIAIRLYGATGTTEVVDYQYGIVDVGTFDTAYNLETSPALQAGSGNVIFSYPIGNANEGQFIVGIDNGNNAALYRVTQSTMLLNQIFYPLTGDLDPYYLQGVSSISIDDNNNVLIAGHTGTVPWAQVIDDNFDLVYRFDMSEFTNLTAVHGIYQQKSGRYIIAASGLNQSSTPVGILVAFQDHTINGNSVLKPDYTFNPLGTGSVIAGSCSVGATGGLYSIAINDDDTIAVAYANTATPKKIVLGVFTANGSGYSNLTFNTGSDGAPITTTISADNSAAVQLNIDGSGNIVVGASYNSGGTHQVQVARYSAAGVLDTAGFGSSGIATITNLGDTGVVLSSLMETDAGRTVLTGYNSTNSHGNLFAARLTSAGVLDTTWNPDPTSPDTAGVLTYESFDALTINSSVIAPNGEILSLGSTATDTSGVPILTLIYGNVADTQIIQNPLEAAAGTKDLTIPGSTSGALPLATLPTTGSVSGVPQKVYIYNSSLPTPTVNDSPNGAMLIASTTGATVYLTQLNSDLSINTSNFGSSGVVTLTPNSGTSPTSVTVTDLFVANGTNDTDMPIYITGYTTASAVNTPFSVQIPSNGSTPTYLTPASSLTTSGCTRQSSNSRILVSGYNGSSGVIVAYNSAMTAIDTSFGNNGGTGYYTTGVANSIVAMTTDNSDRIYIAYKSSASVITVQRLFENGTALDTTFGTAGTATFITGSAYSSTQIKIALDLVNSQVVVAAQDGTSANNIIQLKRFNFSGTGIGNISTITVSGAVLNLADLFIDNDQNIYVTGYISSGTGAGNSVVARVASTGSTTIALDTTYATTGIANYAEDAMTVVTCAALHPDRRVYLLGSNGSTSGYLGRFYGDYYWTQDSQAILQGQIGTIDLTLYPNYTGGIDLSAQSGWSGLSGYTAYEIVENPTADGTSFIAFSNGTNLIVGKVNADMSPVTAFGGNGTGLTTIKSMSSVYDMMIDVSGNIIVVGRNVSPYNSAIFSSAGMYQGALSATIPTNYTQCIAQQKSGRYIVGSYLIGGGGNSENIIIAGYKNMSALVSPGASGSLALDPTFGQAVLNGYYAGQSIGDHGSGTPLEDLVVDSNDYIYYSYRYYSGPVYLGKLTPNGSGPVTSQNSPVAFNSGSNISTGITGTSASRLAINSAGNILVAASTASGVQYQLYNGSTGAAIGSKVTVGGTASDVITKLVGSGTGFYGSVIRSTPSASAYAFAVTNTGTLDTSFGTSGIMTPTNVQSVTSVKGISVQADGKVVMVGGNATPKPLLIRAYGHPYVAQFAQWQDQIGAGQLDTSLWPTTGALNLQTYLSNYTALATAIDGLPIQRVYEYDNGLMLFVAGSSTQKTVLFRLYKDLTLDITLNGTGYIDLGASYKNPTSLFVDSYNNIYVAGNNSTPASWSRGFSSTGTALLTSTTQLASVLQINKQSMGRIIVAGAGSVATGQANTNSYLLGYNSSGVLDPIFATTGQLDCGNYGTITDIAIDAHDNIIAVSNNSGTVVVQKISPFGNVITNLATNGSSYTAITGAVSNPKIVVDNNQNIVVAVATSTGFKIASYINDNATPANTGNNIGSVTITAGTTPVLTNIYATNDTPSGKITLVGYDSATSGGTAYDAIVARFISATGSLALDVTAFNTALTGAGTPAAGILITSLGGSGSMNQFNDAIIHADDRIMLVGSQAGAPDPYMTRVFGDTYVSYDIQAPSPIPGILDVSFGSGAPTTGQYVLSTLGSGALNSSMGKAILPLVNGGYYMVVDNGTNSLVMKTLSYGALDTTYNSGSTNYSAGIAQSNAPAGAQFMMMDASSRLLITGTTAGAGWIQRYTSTSSGSTSGLKDSAFNGDGIINIAAGSTANAIIEQTLARYVVAGSNATGAALYAYTSINGSNAAIEGVVDTTFNDGDGGTPGYVQIGSSNPIYNLIADSYDRLIFAVLNSAGNAVDLYRLTPTGELDITFGSNGKVAGAIAAADTATSVRIAFDLSGNILVTATNSTNRVYIRSFNNGTSTTAGGNGAQVYAQLSITALTNSPKVTALVTSTDGTALILGNQSGTNSMWVAKILASGSGLDTTFNPSGLNGAGSTGGTIGIFQYSTGGGDTSPAHVYNAMTVNQTGVLGILGYEDISGTDTPSLVQINNNPYYGEVSQSPDSKVVGTNDLTLGVSATSTTNKGVVFYAAGTSGASYGQIARAVAVQDGNNVVVALDGAYSGSSGASQIYLNMFDTDGLLNTTFNASAASPFIPGQAQVLSTYQNQYVNDMVTFTTVDGVHKAILAGYTYNSALPSSYRYGSLLLQYNLSTQAIDTTFGGLYGNPAGVAFGNGKSINVIGVQSNGRIIAGGQSQDGLGLLLGYTAAGKLDNSFGTGGYVVTSATPSSSIYTHVIDNENRVIVAYIDQFDQANIARFLADGSGLDTTFGTGGIINTLQTTYGDNGIRLAVDTSNNVFAAVVADDYSAVNLYSYTAATGVTLYAPFTPSLSLTTFLISKLLIDESGKAVIVGYDTSGSDQVVIARTNTTLSALDSTFNPNGTAGYLKYAVTAGTTQATTDALIHPDGRIIVVGSKN